MKLSIRTKIIALLVSILVTATFLISYRQLRFFKQDKETYIYDLTAQLAGVEVAELERKIHSTEGLLHLFAKFGSFRLQEADQQELFDKYRDFYLVGTYQVGQESLFATFAIRNNKALEATGLHEAKILADPRLLAAIRGSQGKDGFALNVTADPRFPSVMIGVTRGENVAVLGILPQSSLLATADNKKVYTNFVVNQKGDLVMHDDGTQLMGRNSLQGLQMVQSWLANPTYPQTREFTDDHGEKILGTHANVGKYPLGLFIQVPKSKAFEAARRLSYESVLWAGLVSLISILVAALFAITITRPIRALSGMTMKVAKGDFNVKLEQKTKDEIGELVGAFNRMSDELRLREEKLEETHQQLVQSEKMSAFGQMSAGIAHEVKNPLAGILGYAQLSKRKLQEADPLFKYIDIIEKETKRCKEIIENLMRFARAESRNSWRWI